MMDPRREVQQCQKFLYGLFLSVFGERERVFDGGVAKATKGKEKESEMLFCFGWKEKNARKTGNKGKKCLGRIRWED